MTSDSRPTVTRAAMEEFYGADGVVRVPVERLPAVVTDPGARAFLTEVGLPTAPGAVVPADERFAAGSPAHVVPEGGVEGVLLGDYCDIGFLLNGTTGAVHAWSPYQSEEEDARPVHRDLHSYVRCLMAFRGRELWLLSDLMDTDTRAWCRERFPEFAELCPEEDGDLFPEDMDQEALANLPAVDDVLAELTTRLQLIEPEITDAPVWQVVLQHFRHGF